MKNGGKNLGKAKISQGSKHENLNDVSSYYMYFNDTTTPIKEFNGALGVDCRWLVGQHIIMCKDTALLHFANFGTRDQECK